MDFRSIEIAYFLHATEDYDRVIATIAKELNLPIERFEISSVEGHYGNPLKIVKAHIIGAEAENLPVGFFRRMSSMVKESIVHEIGRSVNEHGDLFVRLDKQQLLVGKIILAEIDPVRIKFKIRYNMYRAKLLQTYAEFFASMSN
ncbi:MAG: hypothetical protein FJ358_04670 [Thaumarchaeota archaeon]|nr:hypothetical protein [Nitrososphaerota archaeon]